MKKAIIIFGTTTGNTEKAADIIKETLEDRGLEVTEKNVTDTSVDEVKGYDYVLLGASTWGEGEIQDDFIPFYEEMSAYTFGEKDVAVFGCGDSDMFSHCFCEAVKMIQSKAQKCTASIIAEGLRIDGDVDDNLNDIKVWAESLTA